MAESTLMETGERLIRFGHALNRIRRQLRGAGLLEEAESIRVAARECWRAGRLIERKPAAADMFREYLSNHPSDRDDPDDDELDAELDRLFSAE
ncbi:MAG TPA: hypothetical protein VKC66_03735 [Xanthobacteraceae bacterium]|nr:hypothetical protein [Xanthobacteraceae bacterium]